MIGFKKNISDSNMYVHCKTVEQLEALFNEANKLGLTWKDNHCYTMPIDFNPEKCYNFSKGVWNSFNILQREIVRNASVNIIEFEEINFDNDEKVEVEIKKSKFQTIFNE